MLHWSIPFLFDVVGLFNFIQLFEKFTANGLGIAEVGELEVQMFNLVQIFIRIPKFKFSTSAPILANPCWQQYLLFFS